MKTWLAYESHHSSASRILPFPKSFQYLPGIMIMLPPHDNPSLIIPARWHQDGAFIVRQ